VAAGRLKPAGRAVMVVSTPVPPSAGNELHGWLHPHLVPVGKRRPLHRLGGGGRRNRLPSRYGGQPLQELQGGVHRIHDLLGRAPALGRSLLKQPQRIPIAPRDVDQPGFGEGRRDGVHRPRLSCSE
jgi:hypothetical protein